MRGRSDRLILAPLAGALGLALAVSAAAQEQVSDNPEVAAMFAADQAQRSGNSEDPEAGFKSDTERRARTRALYEAGALKTAADYFGAAFIFQHGNEPRDYLFAHTLAVRSLALGRKDAEWIAAATLDRYLQSIGQPQAYGTQYRFPDEGGVTMEPYDRALLTDAQRRMTGAGDLAAQNGRLEEYAKLVPPAAASPGK
ncbi:MAG: hypothetical protein ACOVNS_03970 [Erythrobacter sp.]